MWPCTGLNADRIVVLVLGLDRGPAVGAGDGLAHPFPASRGTGEYRTSHKLTKPGWSVARPPPAGLSAPVFRRIALTPCGGTHQVYLRGPFFLASSLQAASLAVVYCIYGRGRSWNWLLEDW